MRNYKNKVCFIQSEVVFEDDTRREFLKINKSQFLTSTDEEEVFDFIKKHACENHVYNFVLHISSKVLSDLLDYMEDRKESSRKTRRWLKKCTFIATYSNADYVREKVKSLNANVYFALSPISSVLKNIPDGSTSITSNQGKEILVVVSNTANSPYFDQIFNYFSDVNTTLVKYKLANLTLENLNAFAAGGGYLIVMALDTEAEYNTFGTLIKNSNYNKLMNIIECTEVLSQGLQDIQAKLSDVQTSSSGVSIQGLRAEFNPFIPYENCAASVTLTWKCWDLFKEGTIINKPQ